MAPVVLVLVLVVAVSLVVILGLGPGAPGANSSVVLFGITSVIGGFRCEDGRGPLLVVVCSFGSLVSSVVSAIACSVLLGRFS